MPSSLDTRFFKRVSTTDASRDNNGGSARMTLEAYSAVYARSTMVLFSRKTHSPLAALTLKADDVGCLSMFTARPAPPTKQSQTTTTPTPPYFQGMLNMPDEKFTFTISNLSEEGMINFNVLRTPNYKVSTVDPGPAYGINEVNELHPNQSYTIEGDQSQGNRRMVLTGKTKKIAGSEEPVKVTVRESEAKEDDPQKAGLYFYLSVVADKACAPLVAKFAEGTVWKVVPFFVRRVSKKMDRFPPFLPPMPTPFPVPPMLCSSGRPSATFPSASFAVGRPSTLRSAMSPAFSPAGEFEAETSETLEAQARLKTYFSKKKKRVRRHSPNGSASAAGPAGPPGSGSSGVTGTAPVDVGSTQAAELKHAEKVVVSSGYTGHDYAYEHPSEPTVLCLSIWEEMKFLPLPNVEDELSAQVQEWLDNEGKNLIHELNAIYTTDTCVIDLESEADTIICTCGHQCINHANVTKDVKRCPMCRNTITAFVRADGILV